VYVRQNVYSTWNVAVLQPKNMQVRSGRGSMVYVTKMMNRKYHANCMRFSWLQKPILAPKMPVGLTENTPDAYKSYKSVAGDTRPHVK
jgi:hypothetical protein